MVRNEFKNASPLDNADISIESWFIKKSGTETNFKIDFSALRLKNLSVGHILNVFRLGNFMVS